MKYLEQVVKDQLPDLHIKQNWSELVNSGKNPNALNHMAYLLARYLLAKRRESKEQLIVRLKKAFNPDKYYSMSGNKMESFESLRRQLYKCSYLREVDIQFKISPETLNNIRELSREIYKSV